MNPSTTYDINFEVDILTVESEECVGVGGGPSSSVYVKSSVLPREPKRFVSVDNETHAIYRVDIDDGQSGGKDVAFLGSIGLPISCEAAIESPTWEVKVLENSKSFSITTDSSGESWIYVSIDSGFEGASTVYITNIEVEIFEK